MDNYLSKVIFAGIALFVVVVGLIIFGAFLVAGSISNVANAQESNVATVPMESSGAVNDPITISKILDTPVVYKDLDLSLEGKVVGWVTKNVVIVNEVGENNSKKSLLVIHNQRFRLPGDAPASELTLGENVNIGFTGTVRILNISDEETGLGDELELKELRKWNNTPVIFSNSVTQK